MNAMSWGRFKEILEAKGITDDTMIDWIQWEHIDRRGQDHEPDIRWWKRGEPITIE